MDRISDPVDLQFPVSRNIQCNVQFPIFRSQCWQSTQQQYRSRGVDHARQTPTVPRWCVFTQVTKVRHKKFPPEPRTKKRCAASHCTETETEHVRGCASVGNSFLRNKLVHFNNFLLNLWKWHFNDWLHCAILHLVNNVTSLDCRQLSQNVNPLDNRTNKTPELIRPKLGRK